MITDGAVRVNSSDTCINPDGFGYASEGESSARFGRCCSFYHIHNDNAFVSPRYVTSVWLVRQNNPNTAEASWPDLIGVGVRCRRCQPLRARVLRAQGQPQALPAVPLRTHNCQRRRAAAPVYRLHRQARFWPGLQYEDDHRRHRLHRQCH
jgi:hypothetical protein